MAVEASSGNPGNLFIRGLNTNPSGEVWDGDLYINGGTGVPAEAASIPLVMGVLPTGSIDLFIAGATEVNDNMPLFLQTHPFSTMDLFIGAVLKTTASYRPLSIIGSQPGTENTDSVTLYTIGKEATSTANIPLFIEGAFPFASMPLYVANSGMFDSIPLFAEGGSFGNRNDGPFEQDGYIPVQSSLDLFINRVDENASIPLYLEAAKGINASLDLLIPGQSGASPSGVLDMFVEGLPEINNNMMLYARGGV